MSCVPSHKYSKIRIKFADGDYIPNDDTNPLWMLLTKCSKLNWRVWLSKKEKNCMYIRPLDSNGKILLNDIKNIELDTNRFKSFRLTGFS